MTPDRISEQSFHAYPPVARAFALQYLPLLQRLPLAICPSFLQQVHGLDTSFPAERNSLRHQCDALASLNAAEYTRLTQPLAALALPPELQTMDWVSSPAAFVTGLTAHLWSSGQMPTFRAATAALFAVIPPAPDTTHRLVVVLLGAGATVDNNRVLRKLRRQGTFLTALRQNTMWSDVQSAFAKHAAESTDAYAHWYVDGGSLQPNTIADLPGTVTVSYAELSPVRERVLRHMQTTIASGSGGAEQMRDRLAGISHTEIGAQQLTADPVLQRFYTELFTQSSGPQIFSTSFVQWTGRELARRAQPRTLLLRYQPRQQHQDLNELFAEQQALRPDPQASLRDAEMGTFYHWIEMSRISAPGKLTFAAVVEGTPLAVIVGPGASPNSTTSTPATFAEALQHLG